MNRYILAALYVMAGCVVTLPLKGNGIPEPARVEKGRFVITCSFKVLHSSEEGAAWERIVIDTASDIHYAGSANRGMNRDKRFMECPERGSKAPENTSCRIRAPGDEYSEDVSNKSITYKK